MTYRIVRPEPNRRTALVRGLPLLALVWLLAACAATSSSTTTSPPSSVSTSTAVPTTVTAETTTVPETPSSTVPTVGDGEAWIVFQGVELGFTLIRPDWTGSHVILGPPGDQVHPDWSPDGSQIAYVQNTDETSAIWITDPQGNNPTPLVAEYPAELGDRFWDNPAWSPDGSQIATIGYLGNPNNSLPTGSVLAIITVDSGEITIAGELAVSDGFLHSFPRWSPDGTAFVINIDHFEAEEGLGSTVAIVRNGENGWSEPDPITDLGQFARPDWHPTEDLIVFCTYDVGGWDSTDEPSNLFTIRPDGTELTQVTDFGPGEARGSQPTWTADGRIIFTYITGADDEHRNIAFINADGSGLEVASDDADVGDFNRPHPRLRPVP